ncbi:MAG: Crp/Fnr family transcriptional regulator [Candidatus Kapabacteria bacterium]|nr:Crp/Fnr family transcriptional regulator [Candidatus Kapabacteria bacterium]
MDKKKIWHLENFNLLENLSQKEMMNLDNMAVMKNAAKNEIIYLSDESSDNIYFLKNGRIKISKYSDDGKELVLAMLGPGEIFGESVLSGGDQREEDAEAMEDAVICSIDHHKFTELMVRNPELNLKIIKFIGFKLKKVQSKLEQLIFKNYEERIRYFIQEMAVKYGKKIVGSTEIVLNLDLTHDNIAKLTATTRQKVSAVFNKLEQDDIISYNRKKIIIKDYSKLAD